jgi:hypothetical protein
VQPGELALEVRFGVFGIIGDLGEQDSTLVSDSLPHKQIGLHEE